MIDLASPTFALAVASLWLTLALLYRLLWHQRYGTVYGARLQGRVEQVRARRFRVQQRWVSVGPDLEVPKEGDRVTVDGTVGSAPMNRREELYRDPVALPGFVALQIRRGTWPQLRFVTRAGLAVWLAAAALVSLSADSPAPLQDMPPVLPFVDDEPAPQRLRVKTKTPQMRLADVSSRPYIESVHPDVIPRIIRRHLHYLAYCFIRHVAPNDLITEVQLSLPTDSDGVVIGAHFRQSSGTPPVDRCIRDEVLSWRFPSPNSKGGLIKFSVVMQWNTSETEPLRAAAL